MKIIPIIMPVENVKFKILPILFNKKRLENSFLLSKRFIFLYLINDIRYLNPG